jgi:hypothetical protein
MNVPFVCYRRLNARTSMAFIACFLADGAVGHDDTCVLFSDLTPEELSAQLLLQCEALSLAALLDPRLKSCRRSEVAAAVLLAARQKLGVRPQWSPHLTQLTGFASADLLHMTSLLLYREGDSRLRGEDKSDEEEDEGLEGDLDALTLSMMQSPSGKQGTKSSTFSGASPTSVTVPVLGRMCVTEES